MATTVPPAYSSVAALDLRTATLGDIWRHSDATGIPAGAILRALDQDERRDA